MTTYNSTIPYTGDGVTTRWTASFSGGYISEDHVFVETADTLTPAVIENTDTVVIEPAVADGVAFAIRRITPSDLPIVDYTDGAGITETNLDTSTRQPLMVSQETKDELSVLSDQALKVPFGEIVPELPALSERSGNDLLLGFDQSGDFQVRTIAALAGPRGPKGDPGDVAYATLAQADGSTTVGHEGGTVGGAIGNSSNFRPKRLLGKMFAANSNVVQLRMAAIGDSLASKKMEHMVSSIDRSIGGTDTNGIKDTVYGLVGSAGKQGSLTETANYTFNSNAYSRWFNGYLHDFAAGGTARVQAGGADPTFTELHIPFIKEPGAGDITVTVDGVAQPTVSASIASGRELGVINISKAYSLGSVVYVSVANGPVSIIQFLFEDTSKTGTVIDRSMARGGLLLSNIAPSFDLLEQWLDYMNFDYIDFEMDDNFADEPNSQAFRDFVTALNAGASSSDKLIIGSTPRLTNDEDKKLAGQFLRGEVEAEDSSWGFFDSYGLMGSYPEMVAAFGPDDGTHPNQNAQYFCANAIYTWLGLDSPNLPFLPTPLNASGSPCVFRNGTSVVTQYGNSLVFDIPTGNFGDTWQVQANGAVEITDKSGNIWAKFGSGIGQNQNVLPTLWYWGSQDDPRRLQLESSSQRHWVGFRKSDNATGYMGVKAAVFTPTKDTLANVNADFNANSSVGSYAYLTDGVSGAGAYIAVGPGGSDWRKVMTLPPSTFPISGWSADTGTGSKASNATYNGSVDVSYNGASAGASYSQTIAQNAVDGITALVARVNAQDDVIKANSQTIKALKDALIEAGIITT